MRQVFFWYSCWPQALEAFHDHASEGELAFTGPSTWDYWRQFAGRWTGEEDLVCVEQDVVIHDQVMAQFAACPEPWCSFPYLVGPGQLCFWWLGCTRFTAELQRAIPIDDLCKPNPKGVCDRCTSVPCHRHLDTILPVIGSYLGHEWPHIHEPGIHHLQAP